MRALKSFANTHESWCIFQEFLQNNRNHLPRISEDRYQRHQLHDDVSILDERRSPSLGGGPPPLPSKASAPSVLAAPPKKRKTTHLDSANSDAAANPLVTPPPPRTNISRAEMPPRMIDLLPAVATARRAPAGGQGGAGDAPDAPNLSSPASKAPSTPGADAEDPAPSPGLEPSTEEVPAGGQADEADEAPLDGGQAPGGAGGVSASPNAASLANMLPPISEVEAGQPSPVDDGEPAPSNGEPGPSTEEAAAGGAADGAPDFMEEALRNMLGGGMHPQAGGTHPWAGGMHPAPPKAPSQAIFQLLPLTSINKNTFWLPGARPVVCMKLTSRSRGLNFP